MKKALKIILIIAVLAVFVGISFYIDYTKIRSGMDENDEVTAVVETFEDDDAEEEADDLKIKRIKADVIFEPIEAGIEIESETEIETAAEVETAQNDTLKEPICENLANTDVKNAENDDLMLLAKLIMNEAGADYCSDEHQRAVASVLMNHVASPYFPDTIYDCIMVGWFDGGHKNYGIGSPEKFMSLVPTERALANAQYVMTYGSTVGDAIYQAEFVQGEIVAVFSYSCSPTITYICK